jgi:hypothetical protein
MASTYSNLKFELIATGEQSGQWGTTTNSNIGTAIEQAITGMATLVTGDFTANVATLTLTNTTAAQNARAVCLNITATLSAAGTLNVPAIQKPYIILNNSVGGFAVTVKVSGQTGISIPSGKKCLVYNNGTDVGDAITHLSSLTLAAPLPITSGGSGTATPAIVAGSGISVSGTWPNQTVAATNSGTVTSVTASSPLASSGGATPNITVTSSTGSGAIVLATSPTLVTPILGTPTSGTLTNCTFPTLNQNTTGSAGSVVTTNFSVVESGGKLLFKYGATTIASMDSSGNFTNIANITAFGTP